MTKNITRLLAALVAFFAVSSAQAVTIQPPTGYVIAGNGDCYWSYDALKQLTYTGSYTDYSILGYDVVSGKISYAKVPVKAGKTYMVGMYYKDSGSLVESITLGGESLAFNNVTAAPMYTDGVYEASTTGNVSLEIKTTDGSGISLYVVAVFESKAGGDNSGNEETAPSDGNWKDYESYTWNLPADAGTMDAYIWAPNASNTAVTTTYSGAELTLKSVKLKKGKYRIKYYGSSYNGLIASKIQKGTKDLTEYAPGTDFVGGVASSVFYTVNEEGTYRFMIRSVAKKTGAPLNIDLSKISIQYADGDVGNFDDGNNPGGGDNPGTGNYTWHDITPLTDRQTVDLLPGTYRIKIEGVAPEGGYHAEGAFVWNEMIYDIDGVAYTKEQSIQKGGKVTFILYPANLKFTLQGDKDSGLAQPEVEDFDLVDRETYMNDIAQNGVKVTYTRTFDNTAWQPLYIPFNMSYEEWAEYADVAEIAGIEVDSDVKYVLFNTVTSGEVTPNKPYVIRAKAEGEVVFTCENKNITAAEVTETTINKDGVDYTFVGNYRSIDITGNYGMYEGNFVKVTSENKNPYLKAYRFYLTMSNVTDEPAMIRIKVDGELTGIEGINNEISNGAIYDLMGRKVVNPAAGIYVRDGKKVYIK